METLLTMLVDVLVQFILRLVAAITPTLDDALEALAMEHAEYGIHA